MKYKNLLKSVSLVIILSLLSLSCDDAVHPGNVTAPEYIPPVVSGIFVTGDNGPEAYYQWGNPVSSRSGENVYMSHPYPNPSLYGAVCFQFQVRKETNVEFSILRAKPAANLKIEGTKVFNAWLIQFPEKIIISPELRLKPGTYSINWEYNKRPDPLPEGFYRVYLKAGEDLVWEDILITHYDDSYRPIMSQW